MTAKREILLVDDNPADIDLTSDVLARSHLPSHVQAVTDGVEAVTLLRRQGKYASASVPDLVVLDLNLPKKDGRAVLAEVKKDPVLRRTPVVIFSTSQARHDIASSYELGANSYVSKPGDLQGYVQAIESIENFWLGCARLPHKEEP
jgi:chemotaxis family two-component system response regulator Rcp1